MDWSGSRCFLFTAFLILAAAIDATLADTTVSGTVFCDQCKDGQLSLFDYPVSGIKVKVTCADSNGQITTSREETTNWLGNYAVKFDGTPNLGNCFAQVSGSDQESTACGAAAGPAQNLRLMFRMFGMELYAVDSLLTQPAHPMSFCSRSSNPNPVSPPVTPVNRPPSSRSPPTFNLPPLPPLPPTPFTEASACPHQNWTKPEYKCYWRGLRPDAKVALVFGPAAARRYGTNMTLWEGLQGRGDPYRTLLREATTALLNSHNSLEFPYNTVGVVTHTNRALRGSSRSVLLTAFRFLKANSGSTGKVSCKLTPCK
ncbi:uncharacterized protein LOC116118225 [Pistacia vera]|uniref:uncharacterized protein LOC116118225 n=1 Tax=Pistacia vera TaxID=55513 RepID=UPI001262E5A1|nr:uncharacterized protein LOC116118225 [Pistacia vera]